MKRDMDLIREILIFVEDNYKPGQQWIREIKIDGYDDATITEHILLTYQSGFVQRLQNISTFGGTSYWVGNLTNEGYDYLDKIREDTVWNNTKKVIKERGLPMLVETVKTIATALITAATEGAVKAIMSNGGQA